MTQQLNWIDTAREKCTRRNRSLRGWGLSWCYLALAVGIAIALGSALSAAYQTEYTPDPASAGPVIQATISPLIEPEQAARNADGAFVMIQGMVDRRLVYRPLGSDGPAMEIDRHVGLWPLILSPDGRHLVYATASSLMVFDVDSGRAAIVGRIPDGATVGNVQWAPDSRSLAYSLDAPERRATFTTRADGSTDAIQMTSVPSGLPVDVGWLLDGRPVSIYIGIGQVGGLEARYLAYDPATGEKNVLDEDATVIQPWMPWRSPDRQVQLFPLGQPQETQWTRVCLSGEMGMIGADWLYLTAARIGEPEEMVFEVDSVFLDRPTWLVDGRVLMRGLPGTACDPGGMGIYLGELGDKSPEQIIQTPPVFDTTNSDALFSSLAFAVGPGEREIAWTTHDRTVGQSAIHVMPLDDGEPRVIYQTALPDGSASYAFQDSALIINFVWLPGPLPDDPRAF